MINRIFIESQNREPRNAFTMGRSTKSSRAELAPFQFQFGVSSRFGV